MHARLSPLKLGLAAAIMWGVVLFCMTWVAMYSGYGTFWLSHWIDLYPGFNLTWTGSFIGLIYAFIDGFVTLYIFGWLYNLMKP